MANHITNSSSRTNINSTIGSILTRGRSSSEQPPINSPYWQNNIKKWREIKNSYEWYDGSVSSFHQSFANSGLAFSIIQEFNDLVIGSGIEIKEEFNHDELNKSVTNCCIAGYAFLVLNLIDDKPMIATVSPLNVITKTADEFSYWNNFQKDTIDIYERKLINGKLQIKTYTATLNNDKTIKSYIDEKIIETKQTNLLVSTFKNNTFMQGEFYNIKDLLTASCIYKTYEMEEARVSKLKGFLTENMVKKDPKTGQVIGDLDTSVFLVGQFDDENKGKASFVNGELRSGNWIELQDSTKEQCYNVVGLGAQLQNMASAAVKTNMTATQVNASISKTRMTIKNKQKYLEFALMDLFMQINKEFEIKFNDALTSKNQIIEEVTSLDNAGSISTKTKVAKTNEDMTDVERMEEVINIKIENGLTLTNEEQQYALANGLI